MDGGVLDYNCGITEGLHAQLREGRGKEAELQRWLEATCGRSTDAEARLEGYKAREASLMEVG